MAAGRRLVIGLRRAFKRAVAVVREVTRPPAPAVGLVSDALRSRPALLAENVLLRQQLLVVRRQVKRPMLTLRPKKAIIAVAASILTAAFHILRNGVPYRDLGPAHFDRTAKQKVTSRLIRRLTDLGYNVQLSPRAA